MILQDIPVTLVAGENEIDILVDVSYRPYRPPPICSDPDNPAYADPGETEEMEIIHVWNEDGTRTALMSFEEDHIWEQLLERTRLAYTAETTREEHRWTQ